MHFSRQDLAVGASFFEQYHQGIEKHKKYKSAPPEVRHSDRFDLKNATEPTMSATRSLQHANAELRVAVVSDRIK
jgi:hypothetical protein